MRHIGREKVFLHSPSPVDVPGQRIAYDFIEEAAETQKRSRTVRVLEIEVKPVTALRPVR